jgi:ubiquinone/menaquinone biosynthesis C-methylase UbiE
VDQARVYEAHADAYERLVAAEDVDGRLLPAIAAIRPLGGARVLEVGVGTARIARQLAAAGARVIGLDRAPAMLRVARRRAPGVPLLVGDALDLPVASGWADLAVAGWVFGHQRVWFPDAWRDRVARAVAGLRRALAAGGALCIVETLGTGATEPAAPTPALAEYYDWLAAEGLVCRPIRTDYQFASVDEAATVTGSFFGDAFAERVRAERWARVPEWTGVWA